jgi:hypothetical protein
MTQSRYSLMSEAYRSMYEGKRGLWDNIHAKRKRGEEPAKPGDKDYPETLNVEEAGGLKQARKNVGADTCWDGYKAKGTKMKGGKSVPNCVKEDYINYLIDHRFATDEESAEAMYDHMSDKWKMMIEDRIEQLDEISKGLATRAYANRRTNEFEGDELHTKSDKTRQRIVNKFGKKAGEDADKAANKKIFGEGAIDAALKSDKKMGKLMKDTDKDVERVRKGGKFNYGEKNEGMSIEKQMELSRNTKRAPFDPDGRKKQRAAQMKSASERALKDTRTGAERMADATGPRKGSNYRGD